MTKVFQMLARNKAALIVLMAIIIAGIIHFTPPNRSSFSLIETALREAVAPVQLVFSRADRLLRGFADSVAELRYLRERNAQLEKQVTQLQQQVYQLSEYKRENEWLRQALDFKENVPHNLLVCEVIGRSPINWFSSITINKGSNDGVAQGMAVLSGAGIVGTVYQTTPNTAVVILGTDPQSAVGGLVQSTGDLVLVEGDPNFSGMLLARPLSRDAEIEPGDVIVTSGLSRLFPKGLPIGEVVEIIPGKYDLNVTVYVQPFVDFARLEYVFVVMPD